MANKTEKKNTAKKANAKENFNPKTFMEVIAGHMNAKPSNGERVVSLAKERDAICDRIAAVKTKLKKQRTFRLKKFLPASSRQCKNIKVA